MAEAEPRSPELDPKPSLWTTLRRTVASIGENHLTDWAAALTYYSLLSLFPGLIALVALIGLFGDPVRTTNGLTEIIAELGPPSAAETFAGPIESVASNRGTAGVAFAAGLAAALWSASGYVGAFIRASNVIYERREGRSFWTLRPLQLAVTLTMIVMMALLAIGLVMTGPVVEAVADQVGIGDTAVSIWNLAKWPVMVGVFFVMVALLYYVTPNAKLRGIVWATPGSLFAIVAWLLASSLFTFYVAKFGSYDKTYGTLAGFVVLLIWFWLTNLAVLCGHQINAERERRYEIGHGVSGAATQIQLPPRQAAAERDPESR